ncbi:MAG: MATE family efflux transporter [Patescibacteria group bacterium]|jgi:putative MATE family efflux protein
MDSKISKLLEGPILKSLFTLAIPIIFANILQATYQLTDAFWVGRLGGAAIASVSVSFPITFLLISLGAGLAVAGSTLIAQYVGAQNKKMVNHVAAQTLLMVAITSVVLGAVGYLLTPIILHLMGVAPDVYTNALKFMRVSFAGLIFTFGFVMFQSIMRGIGQVKMPMFIVLGTVILNLALDPIFIFGWGPIARYGVMGAAMATFGTQALAAIIGFVVLLKGKYGVHLKITDFKPDFSFIKKAFLLGSNFN